MPVGAGKYDALATLVRERAHASTVAVIIIDGYKGSGFSVQSSKVTDERDMAQRLAAVLRCMADQIEANG